MKRFLIFGAAGLMWLGSCQQIRKVRLSEANPKPGTFRKITVVRPEFNASSPSVLLLKTGELAVIFEGVPEPPVSRHEKSVFLSRSADGGRTWSEPKSILTGLWGFVHPALFQLPEGQVALLFGWSADAAEPSGSVNAGFFIAFSYDNGVTFTAPRLVHVPKAGWVETSEDILVLEDGTLAAPLTVGRRNGKRAVQLAVSRDHGLKWDKFVNVSGDSTQGASYREPTLARLPDRRLLCVMEGGEGDPCLYATRSADNGATWERPWNTGVQGKEPDLAVMPHGSVLCAFRDRWPEGVSMVRSHDLGNSWEDETQVLCSNGRNPSAHLTLVSEDLLLAVTESIEPEGKSKIRGLLFVDGPPSAPAGLSGSFKQNRGIHLRWNPVKKAVYYVVYRDTSAAFASAVDESLASKILGTSVIPRFVDRGADTLMTYRYRVSAVRTAGRPDGGTGSESEPSPAVSVKYRKR